MYHMMLGCTPWLFLRRENGDHLFGVSVLLQKSNLGEVA